MGMGCKTETQTTKIRSFPDMTNAILRMLGIKSGSGSGDGSGSESSDPQVRILFSVISKGERQAVEILLKTNMSLVSHFFFFFFLSFFQVCM